jgi:hypothetical protein
MQIDVQAYLAQAERYEAQAAQLSPGDAKRTELERLAVQLRADAKRGYSSGIMKANGPCGGGH